MVSRRLLQSWIQWGRSAGEQDGLKHNLANAAYQKKALNELWVQHFRTRSARSFRWASYHAAARAYTEAFCRKANMPCPDWALVPNNLSIAAVVTVMNEESTITHVLEQLHRLPLEEIVIVVNGSTDGTFRTARSISDAIIVNVPEPLGHDIGRVVGAKLTRSDVLLFIDGDFPVSAEQLIPFIHAIGSGTDVALNDITPYLPLFSNRDSVTRVKEFLNRSLKRPDLKANSLTAVPHALSRKALDVIGVSMLAVPPKAQVRAIVKGLRVGAPASVNVIDKNKRKFYNTGVSNPVADMIIGDHVEALKLAMDITGGRLFFPDRIRLRNRLRKEG